MASKLELLVEAQVKGLDKLDSIAGKMQRVGLNMSKFVTLPLLAGGVAAFKFASDADEATSKASRVFGKAFSSIAADAKDMDDAFSEAQFLDTAGTFGQMAQAMGFTQEESADLSKQWLAMAQDFSSFNNIPIEEALAAIRSGISGEFEPLKRMGVIINETTLKAKALEMGLYSGTGALDANAKALATNALILEQSGAALGDFEATSGGAANTMKTLTANAADMAAELGTQLLPIGIAILQWAKNLFTAFQSLPQPVKDLIVPIAGVAAALGPVLFIGGKVVALGGNLVTAFGAVGKAFTVLKVLMLANPFVALAAAVIAIAALIVLNWDKIVEFLRKAWNLIMGGVLSFADRLRSVWETITGAVSTAWNGIINIIKGVINGIITAINAFIGFINGIQIHIPAIGVGPFQTPAFDWWGLGIPTIPMLAEGGIITAPTLALLGERGPEAVVPLDRGLGETHFHSHIEVRGEDPFIRNEEDLVRTNQRIAFLAGF